MEEGVAVELIATQAELAALVSALRRGEDGDHVRAAHGWRRELVGDELRELVAGRRGAERRERTAGCGVSADLEARRQHAVVDQPADLAGAAWVEVDVALPDARLLLAAGPAASSSSPTS